MPEFCDRAAAAKPEEVAARDPRTTLTWASLGELLNRATNGLAQLDLGPERRCAVFAGNSVETGAVHLAGLLAGASTVPVNSHFNSKELHYILRDSGARAVFVDSATAQRAMEAVAGDSTIAIIGWDGSSTQDVIDFEEWTAQFDDVNPPLDRRPVPNLLYTSGTSGTPKGTELPPTMFRAADSIGAHLKDLANRPVAGLGPHLIAGPMYHTGPLNGLRLLAGGAPVVILDRFDAAAALHAISEHRVASSIMVPTHFIRLLALPDAVRTAADISSLKVIYHTGAPCPDECKRAMIDWWGPIFVDSYGGTEAGTVCSITSQEWLAHPGSVGRTIEPFEAIVLDEQHRPVPPMTEGRLYFRDRSGRGVVYRNDPVKSAAAHVAPGVFTLGEIGYLDADDYVYITDRSADLVLSGGANIYPVEAENELLAHPEILDAACVGIPDPDMGERLIALVVPVDPTDPPDPKKLISFCRSMIAHYKCPKSVHFVDTVNRDAMGKINRRRLRETLLENGFDPDTAPTGGLLGAEKAQ